MNFLFSLLKLLPSFVRWMNAQHAAQIADLEQKAAEMNARWRASLIELATWHEKAVGAAMQRVQARLEVGRVEAMLRTVESRRDALERELAEAKEQIKAMTPDEIAQRL